MCSLMAVSTLYLKKTSIKLAIWLSIWLFGFLINTLTLLLLLLLLLLMFLTYVVQGKGPTVSNYDIPPSLTAALAFQVALLKQRKALPWINTRFT